MILGIWRRWRHRVPLRHQLTATECGAACLAMVASYHGRYTTIAEPRDMLGTGRDGESAMRLAEAAESFGLTATVERTAEPDPGPSIAYLARRHFVVVERVTRRGVRIADPGAGRQWLSRKEFAAQHGGVTIRFTPGPQFTPRRLSLGQHQAVRFLKEFVAVPGGRKLLGSVVVAAALLQLAGLALPLSTKVAVDTVLPGHRVDLLTLFALCVVGVAVLHAAITLLRARLLLALRARADVLLTQRFVRHLLRLPLLFFAQRPRGDLLMRLASVSSTRDTMTQHVLTLCLDAALLSGYLVVLALLAPGYLVIVAILGAAQVLVLAGSYGQVRLRAQRELMFKAEEQNYLVETLQALAPVKANGIESRVQTRWRSLFDNYRDAMVRRGKAMAWVESAQGGLNTLAPLALLWTGLGLVLDDRLTLGTALAANAVAMSVLSPLHRFIGVLQMFAMLRAQIERLYDVLDADEEPSGSVLIPPGSPAHVEVCDLTFRYHPTAPPVLSGLTFTVAAGRKLAIVGRTGSGKSTLALLLLGLLRGQAGTVSHNGVPVELLDVREMRAGCGAVLQELTLFNSTIADNLTLGRAGVPDSDIEWAARVAGLHDDVLGLPMRYATVVGEAGAALSAGQRQRVALARALLHRPRLLVLDEATSHLDPETERRVDQALSTLEVTRVVVSHRLSAIRDAHLILVLDQGRIVARGRHDDLIKEGGLYRTLFAASTNGAVPHALHEALATTPGRSTS
jgi:ABC-type bacteriocin/lantibiotic exporter with double-glycine peptidase domain